MTDWTLSLGIVLAIIFASGLLGWAIGRLRIRPGWGLPPGAVSAMMLMAEAFGADARLVAFMQYLRVAIVVLASSISRFWLGTPHGTPGEIDWFPPCTRSCFRKRWRSRSWVDLPVAPSEFRPEPSCTPRTSSPSSFPSGSWSQSMPSSAEHRPRLLRANSCPRRARQAPDRSFDPCPGALFRSPRIHPSHGRAAPVPVHGTPAWARSRHVTARERRVRSGSRSGRRRRRGTGLKETNGTEGPGCPPSERNAGSFTEAPFRNTHVSGSRKTEFSPHPGRIGLRANRGEKPKVVLMERRS